MSSDSFRSETARASCKVATRTVNNPTAVVRGGGPVWRQVCGDDIDDRLHPLGVGITHSVIATADLIE